MTGAYDRALRLPDKTFLLLGPRATGKTTLLRQQLAPKRFINLLHSEEYYRYKSSPELLRQDLKGLTRGDWVMIDEAQRVPELLNEIHSLYESQGIEFAITGSSARKLKRENANLLAGRALRCDLFPLVYEEMQEPENLSACIEYGTLPPVVVDPTHAADTLAAYVETYLREEIAAEALTRQLEPFARFLKVAAQHHGQMLNVEAVSREASVKRRTIDNYFEILEDTLLGRRLPALTLGARKKEASHPKFYFFDAGVARAAAGWVRETMPDSWRGFSFETLVLNELSAYLSYRRKGHALFHYSVANSFDVDFVVETQKKILERKARYVALEVKLSRHWQPRWNKPLLSLVEDSATGIKHAYGVYLGDDVLTEGAVTVLPFPEFSRRLWAGELLHGTESE